MSPLWALFLLWAGGPPAKALPVCTVNTPPVGFVSLVERGVVPVEPRYHSGNNFTGAPLPGYAAPDLWLLKKVAEALEKVQDGLQKQGLSLLVFDAYRPSRGTAAMVAWAECTGRKDLLEQGYIARLSGHNHGHTVDLTLRNAEGVLDMGTTFDQFSEASHTLNAEGMVLKNRLLLKQAMESQGFRNYSKEWWHYSMPVSDSRSRDVPYGCAEAAEGTWNPPAGWDVREYRTLKDGPSTPCTSPP